MSERDRGTEAVCVTLIIIALLIVLATAASQIRDFQRRVGQLEQRVR